jgi:predicted PurR-regulated permease PerM
MGSWQNLIDFLLSAHITSLAIAMLLYANERLLPISFAVAVAITSKAIFSFCREKPHAVFFLMLLSVIAIILILIRK